MRASCAPTDAGIASPSAFASASASSSCVSAIALTSMRSSRRRATAIRSSSAAPRQPLRPALAKIAVSSPSAMCVSSARSRKTVRCPRTIGISAFRVGMTSTVRGRRASASSATAPVIASCRAGVREQRDVLLRRHQLDGAVEQLVLAQRGGAPVASIKRPQGLERLLELTQGATLGTPDLRGRCLAGDFSPASSS